MKFVTAREFSRRRDEIFYRISPSQVYELYNEYEKDEHESIQDTDAGGNSYGGPRIVTHSEMASPEYKKPYLLLDVRERAEYEEYHMLQARNFPLAYLRRDQVHPELYSFRNVPDVLIIVYCDDERVSREAAKMMVDRGTDNIFVLSGGLNEFARDFPAFVEGVLPKHLTTMPAREKSRSARKTVLQPILEESKLSSPHLKALQAQYYARSSARSPQNSARRSGDSPPISTSRRFSHTQRDDRSESGFSRATDISVSESVISRAMSRKGKF